MNESVNPEHFPAGRQAQVPGLTNLKVSSGFFTLGENKRDRSYFLWYISIVMIGQFTATYMKRGRWYMAFIQEIPGVNTSMFLRAAFNEVCKYHGAEEMDPLDFEDYLKGKMQVLNMDEKFVNRPVNVDFSGGEKKRNEILQMAILNPRLAVLDETDSGLDVDSMRIVADGVNKLKNKNNAMLVITHYQRLLNYIIPDVVHILLEGRIVRSSGKELALEVESKGYDWLGHGDDFSKYRS